MATIRDRYILDVDVSNVNKGLGQLGGSFNAVDGVAGKLVGTLGRFAPIGAIIAGVAASAALIAKPFIDAARAVAPLEQKLKLITDGSIDLANTMSLLRTSAAATRTDFAAFTDLYTRLTVSTEALGVSQADVLTVTENLSRALQVAGADTATVDSVIRQFGQAMASGVVRGDEFNSLVEGLGPALSIMARETGLNVGQLREMANSGELTAEVMFNMLKNTESLNEAFANMTPTAAQMEAAVGSAFNRLTTSTAQYLDTVTGFSEAYRGLMEGVAERVNVVSEAVESARMDEMLGDIDFDAQPLDSIIEKLGDVGEVAGEVLRRINELREERGSWNIFGRSTEEIDADIAKLREIEIQLDKILKEEYVARVDLKALTEATAPIQDIIGRLDEYKTAVADSTEELNTARAARDQAASDIERLSTAVNSEAASYVNINELLEIARQRHQALGEEIKNLEAADLTPFQEFYQTLIKTSESTVQSLEFARQSVQGLNEQLKAGVVSPEVYKEAMEKLNRILGENTDGTKAAVAAQEELNKMREQATALVEKYSITLQQGTADARRELEQLNMDPLSTQLDDISNRLEKDLFDQIQSLQDLRTGENASEIDTQIQNISRATREAIEEQQRLATESYETQRSFAYGWSQAFQEYSSAATNAANNARDVFAVTTRGLEDLIVDFAKTGKFEIGDLAEEITQTLLRQNVRAALAGALQTGGTAREFAEQISGAFGNIPGAEAVNVDQLASTLQPVFDLMKQNGAAGAAIAEIRGQSISDALFVRIVNPEFLSSISDSTLSDRITSPREEGVLEDGGMSSRSQNITYNINAVDARSFKNLVAQDPEFIHAVSERGRRSTPSRRS